jgi:hypothetical protein
MKTASEFVWYVDHPVVGQIILAIQPGTVYKHGYIYAPRIIAERLPAEYRNAASSLELSLGPLGLIPRRYYQEAGFEVVLPMRIRFIAMMEAQREDDAEMLPTWCQELDAYMLGQWAAQGARSS